MKFHYISISAVVGLSVMSLLPLGAVSAEPVRSKANTGDVSGDSLSAASERIRQTGEQMRADLKAARIRLEAKKARDEPVRQQLAEQAVKDAAAKAAKQQQLQEAAQARARQEVAARAESERRIALAVQQKKEEAEKKALARERAAIALREARESADVGAFASEDADKERQLALVTQRAHVDQVAKVKLDKVQSDKVPTAR